MTKKNRYVDSDEHLDHICRTSKNLTEVGLAGQLIGARRALRELLKYEVDGEFEGAVAIEDLFDVSTARACLPEHGTQTEENKP